MNIDDIVQELVTSLSTIDGIQSVFDYPPSEITGYPYVYIGDVGITTSNETNTQTRITVSIPVVLVNEKAGKGSKNKKELNEQSRNVLSNILIHLNNIRRTATVLNDEIHYIEPVTAQVRRENAESPVQISVFSVSCVRIITDNI